MLHGFSQPVLLSLGRLPIFRGSWVFLIGHIEILWWTDNTLRHRKDGGGAKSKARLVTTPRRHILQIPSAGQRDHSHTSDVEKWTKR